MIIIEFKCKKEYYITKNCNSIFFILHLNRNVMFDLLMQITFESSNIHSNEIHEWNLSKFEIKLS